MPIHRPSRRASRTKLKYTFSDDDEDDDMSQTAMSTACSPPPMPPTSNAPSKRSSHTRKRSSSHIRRPRNAFIIFRSDFCERQKMKESGIESDHRHISRIAAHVWNNFSDVQKKVYQARAEVEKAEHKIAYPDYRYTPAGRSRSDTKRRAKRNDDEDKRRCLQLAELLISGVEGKELQEAAKALNKGVAEVKVTHRASRSASKRYIRRPLRFPVIERKPSVEIEIKESLSPPLPLDIDLPPPLHFSSGSNTRSSSFESGEGTCGYFNISGLPPNPDRKSEPAQNFDSTFQPTTYYTLTDGYSSLSTLSNDAELQHPSNHHMHPTTASSLALAQFSTQNSPPPTPKTLEIQQPLFADVLSDDSYHDVTGPSWPASVLSMIDTFGLSFLFAPQSLSAKGKAATGARSERSSSPVSVSQASPWKAGADPEVLLSHATELSFCYSGDEVNFEECIADV